MWTVDPETEPADFADHLARNGIHPDPHGFDYAVMVLPVEARIDGPALAGLEIEDALADQATFRRAQAAAAEAFKAADPGDDPDSVAMQERRLLATVNGEPAGTGGLGLFPPGGAAITGGSVRPKFRGLGVYRALVAARLEIARGAGVTGLAVWGGDMSRPILARLGFETVGWRRFYLDTSTA
jgi:GNAT superfamily N-acetyltransferase